MSNQALTLFEPANVQTLAALAPKSYDENALSHSRCLEAGRALLDRINSEGMSDSLDAEIAKYIERARLTLRKMNSKRTPVTQLFDRIRRAYTSMEADVDPSKADSVPARLQSARNDFAKRKFEEEERRRREEMARQAKENALNRYRADVEEDYSKQFNALVNRAANDLAEMDKSVTLDNYADVKTDIESFPCRLQDNWFVAVISGALRPSELSAEECRAVQANVMAELANRFKEQFAFEVESVRDEILDRLPSKKIELERIAQASAEEAERIKARMEARQAEEAARKEAERIEAEKKKQMEAMLKAEKEEMDSLFGPPVLAQAACQPKMQVKQKVVIESAEDVMAVVAFWWSHEGCRKSVEDLKKEFKKQINFANSAANAKANPVFISNLRYAEEVKAK